MRLTQRIRRSAALIAALALVAVPTFFSILPEAVEWPIWIRGLLGLVWLAVAVVLAWFGLIRDDRIDRWTHRQATEQRNRLARIGSTVFDAILNPRGHWLPPCYEFSIYVFHDDTGELRPVWPNKFVDERVRYFKPGTGATGKAWNAGETFVALGTSVSDATHGLTEAQQAFFADGEVAAATPILDPTGRLRLGVLSAYSVTKDATFEADDPRGVERLRDLAAALGPVVESVTSDA